MAWLCIRTFQRRNLLAARLFAGAFADDPKLALDRISSYRYNAACAALLAAAGHDAEMTAVGVEEWWHLTDLARGWLRAELASYTALSRDPKNHAFVRQQLTHWKQDSDLTEVRDRKGLEAMPAPDRRAWQALWKEVEAVLAAASGGGTSSGR